MTTEILSSNALKMVALVAFAILVLIVCGFLLTMNRDTGNRRPTRDVRKIEDSQRQTPDDKR